MTHANGLTFCGHSKTVSVNIPGGTTKLPLKLWLLYEEEEGVNASWKGHDLENH